MTEQVATTPMMSDFYAGVVNTYWGEDIKEDLAKCMDMQDSELYNIWDKAFQALADSDEQAWNRYFSKAQVLQEIDCTPCYQNPKIAEIKEDTSMWWNSFWGQPEANKITAENYEKNSEQVNQIIAQLHQQWKDGQMYEAGQSFGEFWGTLIGLPEPIHKKEMKFDEQADAEEALGDKMDGIKPPESEHPLADFYGASLEELYRESWTDELHKCLTFDELEIITWDFAITSLYPYDEMNWNKYFQAIAVLDIFNWAPCMENKGIRKLTDKNTEWWESFWSQPDAQQIVQENIKKNEEKVGVAILSLQASWKYGDFINAGKAYADFWGLLMGRPVLADEMAQETMDASPVEEMDLE